MYEEYQRALKNRVTDEENREETIDLLQLVTFKIGDEDFGIDILDVQEIIRIVDITRVPNAKHFVKGVINLRGKIIPIIDLRLRLGIDEISYDKDTRIIVVEVNNSVLGFIVDKVNQVIRIDKTIIEPAPPMVSEIDSEYITGVAKMKNDLIVLLDLNMILEIKEKAA